MKILHITSFDSGGAGLAAIRLHQSLTQEGIISNMIVMKKTSDLDTVREVPEDGLNRFHFSSISILRKIQLMFRKIGFFYTEKDRTDNEITQLQSKNNVFYSTPISNYDLTKHPLVQEADIIQLHWVSGFLDYATFFNHIDKPIVWTLHDINPLMGGFHHYRLRAQYYEVYKRVEDRFCEIKRRSVAQAKNLSIIAISQEMKKMIEDSEIFSGRKVYQVFNSVNPDQFIKLDKKECKQQLSIPENKKVLVFVNRWLEDSEKGLLEACMALDQLDSRDCVLVCIGDGKIPDCNTEIIHFPPTNDTYLLSQYYSAADLLLFPSHQESFGQTPVEAICCGTPVVMTPVGISEDLIRDHNGVRCKDFSVKSLVEGISLALSRDYDGDVLRDDVVKRFNPQVIAQQYIKIYKRASIGEQ